MFECFEFYDINLVNIDTKIMKEHVYITSIIKIYIKKYSGV